MTIALDNLRRNICRFESKALANSALDLRIKMGVGANRSAEFSHPNPFLCLRQPLFGAPEFVKHQGELQSKRDRLGVNAMAAPDHGSHLEALRLGRDHLPQSS